ncbi:MAG: osmoprotectant NAGGN system M42 family peptidase [Candidatus Competibacteraceae bacterium]|nr:osmoprotectant NAGGN system M42 family peptidase [Candidatus Competibacteraceae bacterium]
MKRLHIDTDYLIEVMQQMLCIPSPTGFTDEIVHFAAQELEKMGIPFELTRRGAIRADLEGEHKSPDRAVVVHLDTLGAMVKSLKDNGRLQIVPIGSWSSRFAEGARVTLFTDHHRYRGTILPLKASGHTYNEEIDTQPVNWDQVEVRVDELCASRTDLDRLGFNVGDFIAVDPCPEITDSGYINSRHLDNKAGVATLLAAARALRDAQVPLPVDCHLLFTITEETGSGASAGLHQDVAEMVSIDNATPAPGQNSRESGVTIAMKDSTGPFDYHLTHKLIRLCQEHDIGHQRDVFKYYRCDSASAVEAGNDMRTALVCFGVDGSHGYERTHLNSLRSLAELLTLYMQSEPTFMRDKDHFSKSLEDFPNQADEYESDR